MCLCSSIKLLATNFNEQDAQGLVVHLDEHMSAIRTIFIKSKSLARKVKYSITEKNNRSEKILAVASIDTSPQARLHEMFRSDPSAFWERHIDDHHAELGRRLACVTAHLLSRLRPNDIRLGCQYNVLSLVNWPSKKEYSFAGKSYIDIVRQLGGIEALWWLPLEIPHSTYERYIGKKDEAAIIDHLLAFVCRDYDHHALVQTLISFQLRNCSINHAYLNISVDYGDVLLESDDMLLLMHAFGGLAVPDLLFDATCRPQRRWQDDGNRPEITALEFGLSKRLIDLLSNEKHRRQVINELQVTENQLSDGTITWSINDNLYRVLSNSLSDKAKQMWEIIALRLICFTCSPCYGDAPQWSAESRQVVWASLEALTQRPTVSRIEPVVEALLAFAESGDVAIRRVAAERAGTLLRKTMPNHLHASVALFQSIVCRLGGNFNESDCKIEEYYGKRLHCTTRRDHALLGRLHLSHIENMIQRHSHGIARVIFDWAPSQPSSPLEINTNRRLLITTAKFFQSAGVFSVARDSLQSCLYMLETQQSLTRKSEPLVVSRLADILCELREFDRAHEVATVEMDIVRKYGEGGRPLNRLLLACTEADIGRGRFEPAEKSLHRIISTMASTGLDINDQLLRVRALMAYARIPHYQSHFSRALQRWAVALHEIPQHSSFKDGRGFTTSIIHLSIAHLHLRLGDRESGRQSYELAIGILRREPRDFWIPVVATTWLSGLIEEIHRMENWPVRVMTSYDQTTAS